MNNIDIVKDPVASKKYDYRIMVFWNAIFEFEKWDKEDLWDWEAFIEKLKDVSMKMIYDMGEHLKAGDLCHHHALQIADTFMMLKKYYDEGIESGDVQDGESMVDYVRRKMEVKFLM